MSSNDSTAKEQSFLFNVNKIFLVIHLLMLFMFSSLGVDLMAGVSLISICRISDQAGRPSARRSVGRGWVGYRTGSAIAQPAT